MLVIPGLPAHEWIETQEEAAPLLEQCLQRDYVALDTETTSTDTVTGKVVDWSVAFPGRRVALSGRLLSFFKPLFESSVIKALHNAKFDMHMLANMGIKLCGPIHDTLVMSKLENTERGDNSLKYLSGDGLFKKDDPRHVAYESPFGGKIKNYKDLVDSIGPDGAREYASLDAISEVFVYEELQRLLDSVNAWSGQTLWEYFLAEEAPFTEVLFQCERRGICLDVGYLAEKSVEAEKAIKDLADRFCQSAGKVVNLSSPKQLREVFFGKWRKKPIEYTSGGVSGIKKPSLGVGTLKKWADYGDPNAIMLLEHRKLSKLNGTYLKGLFNLADVDTRVHTTLNQGGAATGRLSSAGPNLQNIPRVKGDRFKIRGAFVAPPGKLLINADYDQLEMKLMADFAEEPAMIAAINTGKDMHCNTAALMYAVPYEAVADAKRKADVGEPITPTDSQLLVFRQNAKTIGFGLIYGEGPNKLAGQLGITFKEAEELIETFFKPFPLIKQFIENAHEYVESHGLVRTLSGRPRHLRDGIYSADHGMHAQALRQAVNAIIQGCMDEEELVQTTNGAVPLKDLDPSQHEILTYSGTTTDYMVHETGEKEVYRVETSMGAPKTTMDHRFMVYADHDLGVVKLSKLKEGDWVVGATQTPALGQTGTNDTADWAELIGILCGDGSYTRDRDFQVCVAKRSGGYTDYVRKLLERVWPGVHSPVRKSKGSLGESFKIDVTNKPFRQRLIELGLVRSSGKNKTVPTWILNCGDRGVQLAALRGLYDTDGGITAGRYPCFTNKSENLAKAFHALCANVGIASCPRQYGDTFRVIVPSHHAALFTSMVRPAHSHKMSPGQVPKQILPPNLVSDVAKLVLSSLEWHEVEAVEKELVNTKKGTWRKRNVKYKRKANFTRPEQAHIYRMRNHGGTVAGCLKMLNKLSDTPEKENLVSLVRLPWAQLRSVTSCGETATRDIEIFSDDHCYICGGLVMHNSAADIVRKAMILCENDPKLQEWGCEMLLQVHDELMFECPEENVPEAMPRIQELMEAPFEDVLQVKLTVGPHMGFSWLQAK